MFNMAATVALVAALVATMAVAVPKTKVPPPVVESSASER